MASSPSSPPGGPTDPARWDPRVLGLVGLICSVFFLFSYFKILRRDCATLQMVALSRNPDQRRRINENLEDFSSQFHSVGLDSYVMHSLPIKQIKKDRDEEAGSKSNDANKDAAAEDGVIECVVCLGEFEEGEWVKSLPNCSHVFHVSCIDMWFQTHSSCPLCRAYVGTQLDQGDQCSIPINVLLESLNREDYHRERSDERYRETQSPNAS